MVVGEKETCLLQRVAAAPIERAHPPCCGATVRTEGCTLERTATALSKHEANYRGCQMTPAIDG